MLGTIKKRHIKKLLKSYVRGGRDSKTVKKIQNPEINILTYNLCWGCMSANDKSKFDKTAEYLAVKCQQQYQITNHHQCADNIIRNITMAFSKNTNTGDCDILALQESTNWRIIYDKLLEHAEFRKCGYIHHYAKTDTGALAELCTIYNQEKFKIISVALGDIGNGRPFQIIKLLWRKLGKLLIVINLHNSHHGSADIIYHALNTTYAQKHINKIPHNGCVDGGVLEANYKAPHKSNTNNTRRIADDNPFIIFCGDTNDHGKFKLWRGFIPLGTYNNSNGKVSTHSHIAPVNSCCAPVGNSPKIRTQTSKEDFTYGDYILANNNFKFIKNNIIPTKGINHDARLYPASDHLPILSILSPR